MLSFINCFNSRNSKLSPDRIRVLLGEINNGVYELLSIAIQDVVFAEDFSKKSPIIITELVLNLLKKWELQYSMGQDIAPIEAYYGAKLLIFFDQKGISYFQNELYYGDKSIGKIWGSLKRYIQLYEGGLDFINTFDVNVPRLTLK